MILRELEKQDAKAEGIKILSAHGQLLSVSEFIKIFMILFVYAAERNNTR